MFIGHLPAAYLSGQCFVKYLDICEHQRKQFVLLVLVGGIFPDIDLLYFYTLGARSVVHHEYWTHIPFYWISIYAVISVMLLSFKKTAANIFICAFFSGILIHLALDTITGQIQWLYPVSEQGYNLVNVPSNHSWWVVNFLTHWTFIIEVVLVAVAAFLFFRRAKS